MAGNRPITVSGAAVSLTSMVKLMYDLPERGGRPVTEAVSRAVLEANPHIAGMNKIPEGTPIVVPDIPDVERRQPSEVSAAVSVTTLLELAAEALRGVRGTLAATHASQADAARETLDVIRSREFKRVAADHDLANRVAEIAAASNNVIKDEQAESDAQARTLDELEAALDEFARVVSAI
jgi:hypothetical protein